MMSIGAAKIPMLSEEFPPIISKNGEIFKSKPQFTLNLM